MNGYRIRRAVLLKIYPAARHYSWLKRLDNQQKRMAKDPDVRRRRAASWRQQRRDLLRCAGIAAVLLMPIVYWAAKLLLSFYTESP